MSKFRGYGFGATQAGDTLANSLRDNSLQQRGGTKYTASSKGYAAFRDTAELNSQLIDKMAGTRYQGAADEDNGILKIAVMGGTNGKTPVANATFELGGKLFKAGGDGIARIVDSEAVNMEIAAYNELTEYELKIMKAAQISDEMAKKLLTKTVFNKLAAAEAPNGITDPDIIATNAQPSAIQFMSPESKSYALALTKLRAAVREAGVILNEETENLNKVQPMGGPKQQTVTA